MIRLSDDEGSIFFVLFTHDVSQEVGVTSSVTIVSEYETVSCINGLLYYHLLYVQRSYTSVQMIFIVSHVGTHAWLDCAII